MEYSESYEWLGIEKIVEVWEKYGISENISGKALWNAFWKGEYEQVGKWLYQGIKNVVVGEFVEMKELFALLFFLGILAAVLKHLSILFVDGQIKEMAQMILGIAFGAIMLRLLQLAGEICKESLQILYDFHKTALPVFLFVLAIKGGTKISFLFSQIFSIVLFLIEFVLLECICPLLSCFSVVVMMDELWLDRRFTVLERLGEKAVCTLFKIMIYGLSAFSFVQTRILSSVKEVTKSEVEVFTSWVPALGKMAEGGIDLLSASVKVIWQGLGAFMCVLSISVCALPILKILFLFVSIRIFEGIFAALDGAIVVGGLHKLGNLIHLYMTVMVHAVLLFFLMLAVITIGCS